MVRTALFILTTLTVIGFAFWAYRENYATQVALAKVEQQRLDIRQAHSRLAVLNAEWAYLNRPDRLRELTNISFDRLGLMSLQPRQFGHVDELAYPLPDPVPETGAIRLASAPEGTQP